MVVRSALKTGQAAAGQWRMVQDQRYKLIAGWCTIPPARMKPTCRMILLFLLLAAQLAAAQGTTADWPSYGGLWNAWRHSELDQVNIDNVRRLSVVWAFQTGDDAEGLQSTPIVVDGVMYVSTSTNLIFAIDAKSGDVLWKYDAKPGPPGVYRKQDCGVAVGHGLVFMGTIDNRAIAVDQKTGQEVWQVQVQDQKQYGCNITGAPLLVKDKIVFGGTGGDLAYRGSISAFDAKTGNFAWRFYIAPAPGEPGNETWEGDSWRYGGGAPWMTGSFDAELDLIYWGTGNAANRHRREQLALAREFRSRPRG